MPRSSSFRPSTVPTPTSPQLRPPVASPHAPPRYYNAIYDYTSVSYFNLQHYLRDPWAVISEAAMALINLTESFWWVTAYHLRQNLISPPVLAREDRNKFFYCVYCSMIWTYVPHQVPIKWPVSGALQYIMLCAVVGATIFAFCLASM